MIATRNGYLLNESTFMPKILVVDDDIHATTLFKTILTAKGFDTFIVNDSSIAVQTADSTNPDLIILDLMMPEPDGFKVCRMLRAHPQFKRTPIVIVTALNDLDSKLVAMGAGANDYLVKPFHIEQLFALIEKQLNKS